jgi:hypothetical protein
MTASDAAARLRVVTGAGERSDGLGVIEPDQNITRCAQGTSPPPLQKSCLSPLSRYVLYPQLVLVQDNFLHQFCTTHASGFCFLSRHPILSRKTQKEENK